MRPEERRTGKPRFSEELLRDAAAYFGAKYRRPVSLPEAEVMLSRLVDFVLLLAGEDPPQDARPENA